MKYKKILYTIIATASTFPLMSTATGYSFEKNSGLNQTAEGGGFANTLFSGPDSIEQSIAMVITIILSFLGVLFLILTIYSGFQWMTAAGNDEQISKAKSRLQNSVIGLAIVLAAYAITYLITALVIKDTFIQ